MRARAPLATLPPMTNHAVQRTGIASVALAIAVLVLINADVPADENGGVAEMLAAIAISVVAAAALFWWAVPRAVAAGPQAAARRGAVIGGLGVLTVVFFWTGLPFVLGGAGAVLGALARERGAKGAGALAMALGVVAALGALAIAVIDQVG